MLHHRKFQLFWLLYYGLYCLYYYGFFLFMYYCLYCLYFYSFYLFEKLEGRTLAIRNAVIWKAVRTNFIYNSLKWLKEHQSTTRNIGSLLGFLLLFCQFREDCDYVSKFRCSRKKSLVDFFLA